MTSQVAFACTITRPKASDKPRSGNPAPTRLPCLTTGAAGPGGARKCSAWSAARGLRTWARRQRAGCSGAGRQRGGSRARRSGLSDASSSCVALNSLHGKTMALVSLHGCSYPELSQRCARSKRFKHLFVLLHRREQQAEAAHDFLPISFSEASHLPSPSSLELAARIVARP